MNIKSTLICAAMLAAGMLSAGPVFAASKGLYDVAVKSLVTYEMPKGSTNVHDKPAGNPPHTTQFRSGDSVGIACQYHFDDIHPAKETGHWTIGLYVDNHKTTTLYGYWPSWSSIGGLTYTMADQTRFTAYGLWPRATAGHHKVRCVLNENGKMRETNKTNNQRWINIDVRKPISAHAFARLPEVAVRGPGRRMSPGSMNMKVKHGLAPMPNGHVRKCPQAVTAVSRIAPHQFFAPFASASKPAKIPDGHLTLYLQKDEAINDSLFCTYATRAGNAKSTVEISCKDARLSNKASHSYYCQ